MDSSESTLLDTSPRSTVSPPGAHTTTSRLADAPRAKAPCQPCTARTAGQIYYLSATSSQVQVLSVRSKRCIMCGRRQRRLLCTVTSMYSCCMSSSLMPTHPPVILGSL